MEVRLSLLSNNETMVAHSDFACQLGFAEYVFNSTLGMKKSRPHFLRLDSTGENMDHVSYPNFYNNSCNTNIMKSIVGGFIGSKSCRQEYSQALQPSYCRKRTNNIGSWEFSNLGESNGLSDFVNCFSALVLEEGKCSPFNISETKGVKQNYLNTHLLNGFDDPKPIHKISAPTPNNIPVLDVFNQKQTPGMINDCNKRTKESNNDVLSNIENKIFENVQVEHSDNSVHANLSIPEIKEPQPNTSLAVPISKNYSTGDLHDDMNLIKDLFSEDLRREKIFRKKKHKDSTETVVSNVNNSCMNSKCDSDVLLAKDILTDITNMAVNDLTFTENIVNQNENLPKSKTSYNFCLNISNCLPNKPRKKRRKKRLKCKTVVTAEVNAKDFIASDKKLSGSLTQNTNELWDEPVCENKKSRLERPVCQNAIVKFILGCDSDFSDSEDQNSEISELNDDPWDELDSVFTLNTNKQSDEETESALQGQSHRPKKQVHFAEGDDLTTVHMIMLWDRKGPWEKYGLDRCRFERRIQDVEKSISYCFEPAHRLKIYQNYYKDSVNC